MTVRAGNKNGDYECNGVAYTPNGDVVTAEGENGKYETVGTNKWATSGLMKASDGRTLLEEGIFDLAART